MTDYSPHLSWLDGQRSAMIDLVRLWADQNSGSRNLLGLEKMLSLLQAGFAVLGGAMEIKELPPETLVTPEGMVHRMPLGKALRIKKRPDAPAQVFLGIHYDTVYAADHAFQRCEPPDENVLRGPGVADAKGGLAVMLKALEALEASPWKENLGWEVLLNPDEEIGSPGSAHLLAEAARRNHVGLVFEPAFADGSLVRARKGSGNFHVVIRGRAAHAGRDPQSGRNAINALAQFIVELNALFAGEKGIIVNVANVKGGGPANMVPDLALCTFNVRVETAEDQRKVRAGVAALTAKIDALDGIFMETYGGFGRPPKLFDDRTSALYGQVAQCAHELGIPIKWVDSGGASDGNILSAAGLPTIDSLGVRGAHLHSPEEYLALDSLTERARLTALLLMKLASGEIRPADIAGRG